VPEYLNGGETRWKPTRKRGSGLVFVCGVIVQDRWGLRESAFDARWMLRIARLVLSSETGALSGVTCGLAFLLGPGKGCRWSMTTNVVKRADARHGDIQNRLDGMTGEDGPLSSDSDENPGKR